LNNNLGYCEDPVCANFKVPTDIAEACTKGYKELENYNLEKDFSNFHIAIYSR